MSTAEPDFEDFDREIARLAKARFDRNEPALINALGVALGAQLHRIKAATGLTLTQYLKTRLAGVYDFIMVKPNTEAIWPKGKPFQEAVTRVRTRLDVPRPTFRRYVSWLWEAFATPIAEKRRFYDPEANQVVEADVPGAPTWKEIGAELVQPADQPRVLQTIHANIQRWLEANGLDADQFAGVPLVAHGRESSSLLALVIDALDRKQLQSVTVTLDVVEALLKRHL